MKGIKSVAYKAGSASPGVLYIHIILPNGNSCMLYMVTYKPGIHIAYMEANVVCLRMSYTSQNYIIYRICARMNSPFLQDFQHVFVALCHSFGLYHISPPE